jgi:hypothetical protein
MAFIAIWISSSMRALTIISKGSVTSGRLLPIALIDEKEKPRLLFDAA